MAMTVHVDIVSAEELIFSGLAEFVALPGEAGELGILPGHMPLMTRIKPGAVRVKIPNQVEEELVFVAGGLLEVQPGLVTVLADTAIRGRDLDEAKALDAKRRAEDAMANRSARLDYAKAQAELMEAVAQLAAIQRLRKRGNVLSVEHHGGDDCSAVCAKGHKARVADAELARKAVDQVQARRHHNVDSGKHHDLNIVFVDESALEEQNRQQINRNHNCGGIGCFQQFFPVHIQPLLKPFPS